MFEKVMLAYLAGVVSGGIGMCLLLDIKAEATLRALQPRSELDVGPKAQGGAGSVKGDRKPREAGRGS